MKASDYRHLFLNAPEPLLIIDSETLSIRDMSHAAGELLGFEIEELRGSNVARLLNPSDCARLKAAAASDSEHQSVPECNIRRKDGSLIPVDLSTSKLHEEAQSMLAIHDISEKVKLREQLRQAQKMEAVGMLAGGIAHDFNNLLTIISGYTQMLMVSPQITTERDRTALEQVLRASERAADLTSQLLAFSRRQTIQPKVIELNRIVDQTAAMLRRLIGEDIELRIEKSPDTGSIHADPAQIQQVLLNLVINARDAMPGGGAVTIRTRNSITGPASGAQRQTRRSGYIVLEIADTGTGMDTQTRERIFEPFFTTKPEGKGTGLGLSTVFAIVKQARGAIDIESAVGHGTTFCVYFPRVFKEASEEPTAASEPEGGHETILLVEDEEGVRRAVHSALERRGYNVLVAPGGKEALELSRDFKSPVDLLITDVVMPRMNGRELAKILAAERPEMAVMFISGYPGETLQAKGVHAQSSFLSKPFTPRALTIKVREILDAQRGKKHGGSSNQASG